MKHLLLSLLSSLTATCLAAPTSTLHILHERRLNLVSTANRRTRVQRDSIIPLRIGLKQENIDNGYTDLMEVSDPSSPNYGQHWTMEQVLRKNETEIVRSYNNGWLALNLPAWQAESLLRTEYYEYYNPNDETVRLGCEQYYLPSFVSEYVDLIRPGVSLSPPLKKHAARRRSGAVQGAPKLMPRSATFANHTGFSNHMRFANITTPTNTTSTNTTSTNTTLTTTTAAALTANVQNCGSSITPACLRAMYDLPTRHSAGSSDNLGVFESGGAYDQADLDEYFANFARRVPQGTHPVLASVNGGQAPVSSDQGQGESVIDLDIMHSITYPEPVTLYQVDSPGIRATQQQFDDEVTFLTPFLDSIDGAFCTSIDTSSGLECGTYNLTNVVSASYIALELEYGQKAQVRTCQEIMKLGLMGHTVVFASGDFGVAGFPKQSAGYNGCVTTDLNVNGPSSGSIFNPSFPGNCPYALSVGATKLSPDQSVNDVESVMSFPGSSPNSQYFGSGGGFSNYFPRPSYQDSAVQAYLDNHAPAYPSYSYNNRHQSSSTNAIGANGGVYNAAGRGYPDVSANGAAMTAFVQGKSGQWLGTSLAAPIWASILAMINTERANVGKGTVGFVQPVLYQHPEVFNDITSGSNLGCGTQGFAASQGWDPASGLGTPKYEKLKALFLSLP